MSAGVGDFKRSSKETTVFPFPTSLSWLDSLSELYSKLMLEEWEAEWEVPLPDAISSHKSYTHVATELPEFRSLPFIPNV